MSSHREPVRFHPAHVGVTADASAEHSGQELPARSAFGWLGLWLLHQGESVSQKGGRVNCPMGQRTLLRIPTGSCRKAQGCARTACPPARRSHRAKAGAKHATPHFRHDSTVELCRLSIRDSLLVYSMRSIVVVLAGFLVSLSFARADSVVVFNEIMYHPLTNEPAFEWVELQNQHAVD